LILKKAGKDHVTWSDTVFPGLLLAYNPDPTTTMILSLTLSQKSIRIEKGLNLAQWNSA
jgi:hypothetical protein